MRSDRLKQVLLELDANFDEKQIGFSKFNRFVAEAANRGLLRLQKMENGQFEIALTDGSDAPPAAEKPERSRGRGRRREEREERPAERRPADRPAPEPVAEVVRVEAERNGLPGAYNLLRRAAKELGGTPDRAVRDSDVKRRMLDLDPEFDESTFGFSKFSRFLRQAHDAELINLRKIDNGNYELTLPDGVVTAPDTGVDEADEMPETSGAPRGEERDRGRGRRGRRGGRREDRPRDKDQTAAPTEQQEAPVASSETKAPASTARAETPPPAEAPRTAAAAPAAPKPEATPAATPARTSSAMGLRRGSRGSKPGGPPPVLEGQAVGARAKAPEPASAPPPAKPAQDFAPAELGLPVKRDAVVEYLTKAYKGIGKKSAESLIDVVGADQVFVTLASAPDRIREILGARRGNTLLDAWSEDFARRTGGRRNQRGAAPPRSDSDAGSTGNASQPEAKRDEPKDGVRKKRTRGRRGGRKRVKAATEPSKD
jgi:hypothetical protein